MLVEELRKLSLSCDAPTEGDAANVIGAVGNRLLDALKINDAHIFDVFWKEKALHGVILRPYVSLSRGAKRGEAQPYEIREGSSSTGVWTWVYEQAKPILIGEIKSKPLDQPMKNEATGDEIDSRYLSFSEDTEAIVAAPLSYRGDVWGVLSIESRQPKSLTGVTLDLVKELAEPISHLIVKADLRNLNERQTRQAIDLFSEATRDAPDHQVLKSVRSGFIARPFAQEFASVENALKKMLEANEIEARSYEHPGGGGVVVSEIRKQIMQSHFGIADITGLNPNVMLEVGLMMTTHDDPRKVILLRAEHDNSEIPFDLQPYNHYQYRIDGENLLILNPGNNEFEPAEQRLKSFVDSLLHDQSFKNARAWSPPAR